MQKPPSQGLSGPGCLGKCSCWEAPNRDAQYIRRLEPKQEDNLQDRTEHTVLHRHLGTQFKVPPLTSAPLAPMPRIRQRSPPSLERKPAHIYIYEESMQFGSPHMEMSTTHGSRLISQVPSAPEAVGARPMQLAVASRLHALWEAALASGCSGGRKSRFHNEAVNPNVGHICPPARRLPISVGNVEQLSPFRS